MSWLSRRDKKKDDDYGAGQGQTSSSAYTGSALTSPTTGIGSGSTSSGAGNGGQLQSGGGGVRAGIRKMVPVIAWIMIMVVVVLMIGNRPQNGAKQYLWESESDDDNDLPPIYVHESEGRMNEDDNMEQEDEEVTIEEEGHLVGNGYPVGWVIRPKIPQGTKTKEDGKLHIIFSSGCNYFQHWQSEFLLATAFLVEQRGRITRIVSGCHDKSAENVNHAHQTFPKGKNDLLVPLEELKKSVNEYFGLYLTPSFDGAKDFPWINKPSSIDYFMRHARKELDRYGETVIAILDPDFVFLKRLTVSGSPADEIIATRGQTADDRVRKGRPVAQRYGLEATWMTQIDPHKVQTDPTSPAFTYSRSKAADAFSVGPPLMLHVDDLTELAKLWKEFMMPVLDQTKDILADMFAYCIAAAHLRLEHTILDHYMISVWGDSGQAFPWINAWDHMSCLNPQVPPGRKTPNFIHLASNFKAPESKEWMFHKGHVPANILDCDSPLIIEAPDDLHEISKDRKTKQSAWVICNTVSRLNQVLLLYKKKFCPKGFEQRKLVRLIQRKTRDIGCDQMRDKWCYPLAQIEGLPNDWRQLHSH